MALQPLNTDPNNFPLSINPFLSRTSTHFSEDKNYAMLAFNPGFALQAAELNELQEIFFINQSLTQRMNANWIRINSGQTSPYTAPFWEGLIPLSPDYLSINNVVYNASSVSFAYQLNAGWYLYTDKTSKLSFWAYNSTNFSGTISSTNTAYVGTDAISTYIDCCQTNDTCTGKDSTLRDGSQQSYQEFTCGSSRFNISINPTLEEALVSYSTPTIADNPFCQIFVIDLTSTTNKSIRFPNGFIKYPLA